MCSGVQVKNGTGIFIGVILVTSNVASAQITGPWPPKVEFSGKAKWRNTFGAKKNPERAECGEGGVIESKFDVIRCFRGTLGVFVHVHAKTLQEKPQKIEYDCTRCNCIL